MTTKEEVEAAIREIERRRPPPDTPWTPGPWKVITDKHDELPSTVVPLHEDGQGDWVAECKDYGHGPADARLIAAAPEMAEWIRRIAEGEGSHDNTDIAEEARAILSRIQGEQVRSG